MALGGLEAAAHVQHRVPEVAIVHDLEFTRCTVPLPPGSTSDVAHHGAVYARGSRTGLTVAMLWRHSESCRTPAERRQHCLRVALPRIQSENISLGKLDWRFVGDARHDQGRYLKFRGQRRTRRWRWEHPLGHGCVQLRVGPRRGNDSSSRNGQRGRSLAMSVARHSLHHSGRLC